MAEYGMTKYMLPINSTSRKEAVIQGKKYRITVLTSSLVRMEYNENGYFENRATQSVVNRCFAVPEFHVSSETINSVEWLIIETDKIKLYYDRKVFTAGGLQIQVKELEGMSWTFGQEINDLKGTFRTLDRVDGDMYVYDDGHREKIELGRGIISRDGFSVMDDSSSMILAEDGWVEPRNECIDLYFFGYGHRYLEALNDFYYLCGPTPLLPRYALGNWWSRYYRYTEEEYKKLICRFESEELPFSVAVIDMDWHLVDDVDPKYGSGWTGYTWNRNFFPDPEGFMSWLHEKNMKVTLNVHPADGIRAFEDIYPKMAEAVGIDPVSGETVEFDPSNQEFMGKYFEVLCHDLEKQGVDFWWIDWQQGTESKMPGLDPLWMLNHYHYLDSVWKGTRPMTFSRYAGVGSHRYPIGFSGDTAITWDSLAYQPYFTSTASNIGYGWWSHDIGGHMWGLHDDELMARWVQYGVFSPINRLHSTNNSFSGKEPWKYDAVTRNVMNKYLRLRHGLIPYLYTMNRRASRDNLPLIQPMYYTEPEREEAYQVPNEYYFGTEFIVSPVTSPVNKVSRAAKVQSWLPEGVWIDMFNGMIYEGGKMIDLWRPVEDIPVLMKAGAIVPMKDMDVYDNSVANPEAMEIRIFPAADGNFRMWEDAGDTPFDKEENWASTDLDWSGNVFSIRGVQGNLAVIPARRSWKLVFYGVEYALPKVSVDGNTIDVAVVYDEELCKIIVQIPIVETAKEITVTFDSLLKLADNRKKQCYSILQRTQMSYILKEKIWKELCAEKTDLNAVLDVLEMDESVRACLAEVDFCK